MWRCREHLASNLSAGRCLLSSAPPSYVSSPFPSLYRDMGMVIGFRGVISSRRSYLTISVLRPCAKSVISAESTSEDITQASSVIPDGGGRCTGGGERRIRS
jgi:hypothetical protein